MDLQKLTQLVQMSQILSEADRTFWLTRMQGMTEEQLQKLETILTDAAGLSWSEEMQRYLSIATKATAALTQ